MNKDSKDAPSSRLEHMVLKRRSDQHQPTSAPRILIVDDNPLNAKLVLAQLEHGGYEGTYVESGEAALEALAAGAFSMVLMDCQMAGMDGCATTREIRRREGSERHILVVGLSSNSAKSARAQCLEAGMDGYIARPVTAAQLIAEVQRLCCSSEATAGSEAGTVLPNSEEPGSAETLDVQVLTELIMLQGADGGSLLVELTGTFLRNLPAMVRDLSDAAAGEQAEIARAAHRLKSASTTIGGARLASLCNEIEAACGRGDSSALERLLAEAREEAARLAEKLKEIPVC